MGSETVQSLFKTIGGSAALIAATLLLMRTYFENLITNAVTSTFNRELERFKDELSRSIAYKNHMIEREAAFLDEVDGHLAKLIPVIQDMKEAVVASRFTQFEKNCFLTYYDLAPKLKNVVFRYEPYIDRTVFNQLIELVRTIQQDMERWKELAVVLSEGKLPDACDLEDADMMCEALLKQIADARISEIMYLKQSSRQA